jgi:hypothetical protein
LIEGRSFTDPGASFSQRSLKDWFVAIDHPSEEEGVDLAEDRLGV